MTPYEVFGTILFVPLTSKVVAAKAGELKIVFKDYLNDASDAQYEIPTALSSISQIMIPDRHKMLVVFDNKLDLLAQYIISDVIGCPPDENVATCSQLFLFEQIECKPNFH